MASRSSSSIRTGIRPTSLAHGRVVVGLSQRLVGGLVDRDEEGTRAANVGHDRPTVLADGRQIAGGRAMYPMMRAADVDLALVDAPPASHAARARVACRFPGETSRDGRRDVAIGVAGDALRQAKFRQFGTRILSLAIRRRRGGGSAGPRPCRISGRSTWRASRIARPRPRPRPRQGARVAERLAHPGVGSWNASSIPSVAPCDAALATSDMVHAAARRKRRGSPRR